MSALGQDFEGNTIVTTSLKVTCVDPGYVAKQKRRLGVRRFASPGLSTTPIATFW